MVNGDRVKQARELGGLTQTQLAGLVGVNQSAIAQIESGRIAPSERVLQKIVLATGFPAVFFKQPSAIEFPLGSLLFRARASMTLQERYRVLQHAKTTYEVAQKMEKNVNPILLNLPRLDEDPACAAQHTRSTFGIAPDTPIPNLTNLLERNGILIMALPIKLKAHDAFSVVVNDEKRRPIIVCSRINAGDRLRFSIAHELGHLILHQALTGDRAMVEKEANIFASEFLMPKDAMLNEIIKPVTLASLAPLKLRWKVSIQALIRRSCDLDMISQRQYRYLMQQLSVRGWKTREPAEFDIPIEKPRAISQMAEILYGTPVVYNNLAADMNLPSKFIKETLGEYASKAKSSSNRGLPSMGKVLNFKKTKT